MPKTFQNILVGGSGFIGSLLGERLLALGESVVSLARHDHTDQQVGIETRTLDIASEENLATVFPRGENVYILIGQNNAAFDSEQELETLRRLVEILNQTLPKRVFYFSSALIYGECDRPADETVAAAPLDPYSRFKVEAERLLRSELRKEISVAILRLANVYGAPKNRGFISFVMNHFFEGGKHAIMVNGDGLQQRDYIFVEDVISATIAIRKKLVGSDTINVASGESQTLLGIIEQATRVTLQPLPYQVTGKELAEVKRSLVANRKLRETYGCMPAFSFPEGLQKAYFLYHKFYRGKTAADDYRSRRLLLLGGEGFIGRNIASHFSLGNRCVSVGKRPSCFLVRSDRFLQIDPYQAEVPGTFDTIIHLIDHQVPLERFAQEEARLLENIHLGTSAHLVVFSSAAVYVNPDSEYGRRKMALEDYYADYCRQHGLSLTIFRLFNVFGPYQVPHRPGSLVANLICNHLAKQETEINDMEARRDFMYAPDIPKFVEYVLRHRLQGIFDIGSGRLTTVADLIERLERMVFQEPASIADRNHRESIASRRAHGPLLREIPMVDFDEGLMQTARFYQDNFTLVSEVCQTNSHP